MEFSIELSTKPQADNDKDSAEVVISHLPGAAHKKIGRMGETWASSGFALRQAQGERPARIGRGLQYFFPLLLSTSPGKPILLPLARLETFLRKLWGGEIVP